MSIRVTTPKVLPAAFTGGGAPLETSVPIPAGAVRLFWSLSRATSGGAATTTVDVWMRYVDRSLAPGVPFTTPSGAVSHMLAEDMDPTSWGASMGGLFGVPLPLIESGDQAELVFRASAASNFFWWYHLSDDPCDACQCGDSVLPSKRYISGGR